MNISGDIVCHLCQGLSILVGSKRGVRTALRQFSDTALVQAFPPKYGEMVLQSGVRLALSISHLGMT